MPNPVYGNAPPLVGDVLTWSPTGPVYQTPNSEHMARVPSGALAVTIDRNIIAASTAILTSGQPMLTQIWLPGGLSFTRITCVSGNVGATNPTHQWFGLWDNTLKTLALTNDDLTTAWGTPVAKTLNLSAGSFQTTYTGFHYLGVMVTAATPPQLFTFNGAGNLVPAQEALNLAGTSSTAGLTTPASCPATLGTLALGGVNQPFYMEINP